MGWGQRENRGNRRKNRGNGDKTSGNTVGMGVTYCLLTSCTP